MNARFRTEFGAALERLLKGRGLTQAAVSRAIGKSPSHTNQMMSGQKTAPPEVIDRIADAVEADEAARSELHDAAARSLARSVGYKISKKW